MEHEEQGHFAAPSGDVPSALTVDAPLVPDDFNPTPAKIAALEEQKRKVRAEMLARINELEAQISKLQAIEYTPETA